MLKFTIINEKDCFKELFLLAGQKLHFFATCEAKISIFWPPSGRKSFATREKHLFFIAPPLKIRFLVPVEQVETAIFNTTFKVSTRSTCTENRIFKRGAIKNKWFSRVAYDFFPLGVKNWYFWTAGGKEVHFLTR